MNIFESQDDVIRLRDMADVYNTSGYHIGKCGTNVDAVLEQGELNQILDAPLYKVKDVLWDVVWNHIDKEPDGAGPIIFNSQGKNGHYLCDLWVSINQPGEVITFGLWMNCKCKSAWYVLRKIFDGDE